MKDILGQIYEGDVYLEKQMIPAAEEYHKGRSFPGFFSCILARQALYCLNKICPVLWTGANGGIPPWVSHTFPRATRRI